MSSLTCKVLLIIVRLLVLFQPSQSETFSNVKNQTIHCGMNEDCIIVCNETESCLGATFNVFNNNITIHCSGYESCRDTIITSTNTTSLYMSFNGSHSFWLGRYWSHSDENIQVKCHGTLSCTNAIFHYDSIIDTNMYCDNIHSCAGVIVHGVDSASAVSIHCTDADGSCSALNVISATNNITITVSGTKYATSEYPISIFITSTNNIDSMIHCDNCSLDINATLFIPPPQFDPHKGCFASNIVCVHQMIEALNNKSFTVFDNYHDEYSDNIASQDMVMLFTKKESSHLVAPKMNGLYTLFCIECNDMTLNLTQASNTIISSFYGTGNAIMSHCNIYGPKDSFKYRSVYSHLDLYNNFYLNNTQSVVLEDIGDYSNVYLGDALDVEIECSPLLSCPDVDIYSSLDPMEYSLFEGGSWIIDCSVADSCRPQFLFNFPNTTCVYTINGAQCAFISTSAAPITTSATSSNSTALSTTTTTSSSATTFTSSIASTAIPSRNEDCICNKTGLDAVPGYVWLILVIGFALLSIVFSLLWFRKKKEMDSMAPHYVQLTDKDDKRL